MPRPLPGRGIFDGGLKRNGGESWEIARDAAIPPPSPIDAGLTFFRERRRRRKRNRWGGEKFSGGPKFFPRRDKVFLLICSTVGAGFANMHIWKNCPISLFPQNTARHLATHTQEIKAAVFSLFSAGGRSTSLMMSKKPLLPLPPPFSFPPLSSLPLSIVPGCHNSTQSEARLPSAVEEKKLKAGPTCAIHFAEGF